MVGDTVLLLVGGLVLLIDHDQAEIAIGQEQRRARTRHHLRLAAGDRRLQALAPAARHSRMPQPGTDAETRLEAVDELRRERDLGHQDQALAPEPHRLGNRLEIDLRLARTGDALEQRHPIGRGPDRGDERRRRAGLTLTDDDETGDFQDRQGADEGDDDPNHGRVRRKAAKLT